MAEYIWLCGYTTFCLSINGHLGFFYFLAIMNNVAMNIHAQVFLWTWVFSSLGYKPKSRIAGHMITLCLTFFFKLINLFLLRWVFLAACRLSLVAVSGGYSSLQASHCGGFSCCRAWALGTWASVVVAHGLNSCGSQALERRLSNRGTRA